MYVVHIFPFFTYNNGICAISSHMYVVHISQVSKRAKQKSLVCTWCIYSLFIYSNGIVLLAHICT